MIGTRRYIFTLAATAAVGLAVAACGSGSTAGSAASGSASAGVNPASVSKSIGLGDPNPQLCHGKKYTLGVDYFSTTDPFAQAWLASIRQAAQETGCVTIDAITDDLNPATAVANMHTFVQEKVSAVLLLQVIESAQPGVMQVLNQAKIPAIASAIPAPGATFLTVPDYKSGFNGGQVLGQAALSKWPGKIPYLIMGGYPEGGNVEVQRITGVIDGIKSVIKNIPASHIFLNDTEADTTTAYDHAQEALSQIPAGSPILVSAINDVTAYSEFQAVRAAGRASDALVLGVGAVNPAGVDYVCDTPQYVGAVAQLPEIWGGYLVPGALALINGDKVPTSIAVPWKILTRQNARSIYSNAPC